MRTARWVREDTLRGRVGNTLTYAEDSATTVPELQSTFDAFMESKHNPKKIIHHLS
jgi:hypothetical protein